MSFDITKKMSNLRTIFARADDDGVDARGRAQADEGSKNRSVRRTNGWMDGRTNRWMDRWMDG